MGDVVAGFVGKYAGNYGSDYEGDDEGEGVDSRLHLWRGEKLVFVVWGGRRRGGKTYSADALDCLEPDGKVVNHNKHSSTRDCREEDA